MVEHRKNSGKKTGKVRFYKRKTFWFFVLIFSLTIASFGAIYAEHYTRKYRQRALIYDLDQINKLEVPSVILDRNRKEIGRIFVQNRSVMPIKDVPKLFIDALRAGEDSRFLSHHGIDYIGIARAVILNIQAGTTTQGASTITQQLARNAFPLKQDALAKGESGIERKLVEAFLARRIEERYEKQQILDFYLNRIYFGSGFYGLRSASLGYFGKEPKDLNLVECATIVGLIKNPTNNSPLNNMRASRAARDMVLRRMQAERMISSKELAVARAESLKINPRPLQRGTSHLYERIADGVTASLGEDALAMGGYTIHTTISAEAQRAAEEALTTSLNKAEKHAGYVAQKKADYEHSKKEAAPDYLQGAVFMMDHNTGEVLAHVGGRDYADVPFDFIETGKRPLGTAFFPFLYSAALAHSHNPAAILEDEPMDNRAVMVGGQEGILGEWGMEIASPKYEGKVILRKAFADAKIAASVRLGNEIGIQRIIDAAVAFGFPFKDSKALPRVSVGWEPATLKQAVTAMASFPLGGRRGPEKLIYIDRIENSAGRVVYRRSKSSNPSGRLLDEEVAWQVHNMMQTGMANGSARGVNQSLIEKPFSGAGKGGSTHDFADTWFLGYNGRVSCGVWTGFLKGKSQAIYPGAFSRDLAMPVWVAVMNAITPFFGGKEIKKPDSLAELEICGLSGQRATQFCQHIEEDLNSGTMKSKSTGIREYFRKGSENLPFCTLHSSGLGGEIDANLAFSNLPALDTLPIRPTEAVLLGDDPYFTEIPSYLAGSETPVYTTSRKSILDQFDLGEFDEALPMKKPARLQIDPD